MCIAFARCRLFSFLFSFAASFSSVTVYPSFSYLLLLSQRILARIRALLARYFLRHTQDVSSISEDTSIKSSSQPKGFVRSANVGVLRCLLFAFLYTRRLVQLSIILYFKRSKINTGRITSVARLHRVWLQFLLRKRRDSRVTRTR